MSSDKCLIQDCQGKFYAPTGTAATCKEHFLDFLKWRRRKGGQMFKRYAAMNMEERDVVTNEWKETVTVIT